MITDWDDAYANGAYIAGGNSYPPRWAEEALIFRTRMTAAGRAQLDIPYGPEARTVFDLFLPTAPARGLSIFVHGGYWLAFDKSSWSHLAQGALDRGWAVALPSYTLAPDHSVAEITTEVSSAIKAAAAIVPGPVRLVGHSAGGHLVTRMVCDDSPLPDETLRRIEHVVSISGLHDLRPLLRTKMAAKLFRKAEEARSESPALHAPRAGVRVTCWVGSAERPEFLRQNALLANIWHGLGATTLAQEAPGHHHFNVIDGLADSHSSLMNAVLDG